MTRLTTIIHQDIVIGQRGQNSQELKQYNGPTDPTAGASIQRWPAFLISEHAIPIESSCVCNCAVLMLVDKLKQCMIHLRPPQLSWNSKLLALMIQRYFFTPLNDTTSYLLPGVGKDAQLTVSEILDGLEQTDPHLKQHTQYVHYPESLAVHVKTTKDKFAAFCGANTVCCQASIILYKGTPFYRERTDDTDRFEPLTFALHSAEHCKFPRLSKNNRHTLKAKQFELYTYTD